MLSDMNKGLNEAIVGHRTKVAALVQKIRSYEPFPEYMPGEETKFVDTMKPKHKDLSKTLDELEGIIKTVQDDCAELGVELTAILPDVTSIKGLIKRVLTLCCVNTAARILISKAAANASGHLLQSVEALFDFGSANQLELPQPLVEKMKACRDKLAAAAASKSKVAVAS